VACISRQSALQFWRRHTKNGNGSVGSINEIPDRLNLDDSELISTRGAAFSTEALRLIIVESSPKRLAGLKTAVGPAAYGRLV
jgi:hypothetical protein